MHHPELPDGTPVTVTRKAYDTHWFGLGWRIRPVASKSPSKASTPDHKGDEPKGGTS